MTDTRQVLEEAFKVIHPAPRPIRHAYQPDGSHWPVDGIGPYTEEYGAWSKVLARFRRFLDAEAWTDAAMMLVQGPAEYPDSKTFLIDCAMQTSVHSQPVAYVWDERGKHMGKGKTPAHALLAACLKARENGDG